MTRPAARAVKKRCTFMFNSWKRCDQLAGADGRCGAHSARNNGEWGGGFRRTAAMFGKPKPR